MGGCSGGNARPPPPACTPAGPWGRPAFETSPAARTFRPHGWLLADGEAGGRITFQQLQHLAVFEPAGARLVHYLRYRRHQLRHLDGGARGWRWAPAGWPGHYCCWCGRLDGGPKAHAPRRDSRGQGVKSFAGAVGQAWGGCSCNLKSGRGAGVLVGPRGLHLFQTAPPWRGHVCSWRI